MCGEILLSLDASVLSGFSPWNIPVLVLKETTSSNDEMLRLGEDGAPEGSILFAESQTAGRGRFHRLWSTAPGLGLWFSLLLRPKINDSTIPALSTFAAVAIAETIRDLGIPGCGIKEPNDVLITGRKVAGVLVETRMGKFPFAVVGIGLNVNQSRNDFPMELWDRAGSLAMATGQLLDRHRIAELLLGKLYEKEQLMKVSAGQLLASWNGMLLPTNDSISNETL
jgi:BirA family biotin operon repressor/biotin-[acetyl-CoA-carboxylase] ligase